MFYRLYKSVGICYLQKEREPDAPFNSEDYKNGISKNYNFEKFPIVPHQCNFSKTRLITAVCSRNIKPLEAS